MKHISHFFTITLFEARRFVVYPLEILGTVLQRGGEVLFFVVFWYFAAKYATSGNINLKETLSYFLIVGGITPFLLMGYSAGSMVIKMIKSGELSQVLIKPLNPLVYAFAIRTGRNGISYIIGGIFVFSGIILALTGNQGINVLLLSWTFFNAMVINIALNIFFACVGFYTPEAGGIKNAFLHVSELLRGQKIPLYLLSVPLAGALQLTPFPASMYHFVRTLQGNNPELHYIAFGSVWSVILMSLALLCWNKTISKYEAVGI